MSVLNKSILIISGLMLVCFPATMMASGQTSEDYSIPSDVLSGGGGHSESADYSISASIGQPGVIGNSSSSNYSDAAGFWPRVIIECLNNGDIDANGFVTAGDAQTAFQIALAMYIPTEKEKCAADCNGDSVVTAGDAQAIFQKAIGMGTCAD